MSMNRDLSELSFEELEMQVAEDRERLRLRRAAAGAGETAVATTSTVPTAPQDKFPRETLLWLALPPFWSPKLAQACGFPPQPGLTVEETLEELSREGLTQKTLLPSLGSRKRRVDCYEMTSGARTRLLSPYQSSEDTLRTLRSTLARIGRSILKAGQTEADVTPPLRRWATLAAEAEDADAMAAVFDQQTAAVFKAKRSDELLNWIDTGRPLAAFYHSELEAPIKLALQKASRRLELFFRREIDEKHLQESRFFEREDQINAFKEFMAGPPEHWALHFVGAGGVGKTMLMRKITTGLAEEMNAITARVDFDYFNADYPRLAPGVLLWSFGQELRPYDQQNTVIGLLDDADRTLRDLHTRLSAGLRGEAERPTRHPLFRPALTGYISALKALSKQLGRKVLLIVDTCEELARSRPDGTVPENVEETFRILRALHDGPQALEDDNSPPDPSRGLPDLKVIFSGRRLLAEKGLGWHLKYTEQLPPPGRTFVERSYLKLFEIRGFTHDEARRYLASDPDVPHDPKLINAIIARSSPEAGGLKGLVFEEDTTHAAAEVARCHPYEFIFYRDWAKEEPPPSAQTIRTATSIQYVELRILKRLRSAPLEALMPAVALLGRFNRETLQAVSPLDGEDFENAFENLQRQDWIDLRSETTSDGTESRLVLNAEHGVRKRLLAYYYTRGDLNLVQAKAAAYLEQATLRDDLSHLDWSSFDAALRVLDLDPNPRRAAVWWERVVARVLIERDWTWLDTLLSYLRAEDGAAGLREANAIAIASEQLTRDSEAAVDDAARPPDSLEPPESCMRPAVLATYAAALTNRRNANRSEMYEVWRQVSEKIEPAVGGDYDAVHLHELRLLMRTRAGLVTASRHLGTRPEPQHVNALWETVFNLDREGPLRDALDEQVLAALVAAVETVVEHVEMEAAKGCAESAKPLLFLTTERPPSTDEHHSDDTFNLLKPVAFPGFGPARLVNVLHADVEPDTAVEPWRLALRVFAGSLNGRALAFCGRHADSRSAFQDVLELTNSTALDKAQPRLGWFDWQPPADIAARVRLEFVRAVCPRPMSPEQLLKLAAEWPFVTEGIDADRLRSALIGVRLRLGPVEPSVLPGTGWIGGRGGGGLIPVEGRFALEPDACEAHRSVPPLFIAVAEAFAVAGRADEAISYLHQLLSRSQELGPSVTLHAERAHARVSRLMHTYDDSPREYETMEKSGRVADAAMAWALDGLRGRRNQKVIPPLPPTLSADDQRAWVHAIWQTRYTRGDAGKAAATWAAVNMPLPTAGLPQPSDDFLTWSLFFDNVEADQALQQYGQRTPVSQRREFPDISAWFKQHPDQPEETLTLFTRRKLLMYNTKEIGLYGNLSERVGARRAAEIVLQECELLALRHRPFGVSMTPLVSTTLSHVRSDDHVSVIALGLTYLMLMRRPATGEVVEAMTRKVDEALKSLAEAEPRNKLAPEAGTLSHKTLAGVEASLAAELPLYEMALASRGWRPWLVRRLLLDADRITNERRREARLEALRSTLLGLRAAETAVLPPDLEQWFGRPPEKSKFWLVVGVLAILLGIAAAIAVGGFLLFQWLLSFTLFDITKMRLGLRIVFYVMLWPVLGLIIWRMYVETRRTLNETKEKSAPVSLFSAWKSTAVLAVVLVLSYAALQLKLGHLPCPRWLAGGWFEGLSGPGETRNFWQGAWTILIGGGVFLPAIFLGFRALRTFRRQATAAGVMLLGSFTALFNVKMRVRAAAGATASRTAARTEVPPVEIRQELRTPPSLLMFQDYFDRNNNSPAPAQVTLPPLATYREIAAQADPEHDKFYASLGGLLGYHTMQVQLDLASNLHAPCWESLIVLPRRGEARSPRDLPFRFRRTTEARRALRAGVAGPAVVISWIDSHLAARVATLGWEELLAVAGFTVRVNIGEFELFRNDVVERVNDRVTKLTGETLGVLHLVGTPEDTGEGVRFRLARDEVSARDTSESKAQTKSESGPRVLDAESLAGRFTNLSLCVLQGDPDKWERGERSDDARSKAMLARIFASKLFDLGVPAVLVIPPLKAQLATDVLRAVASVLQRRPRRGTPALMEAVARIQEMIVDSFDSPTDEAWEEALDTCLYAERDWNARLTRSTG